MKSELGKVERETRAKAKAMTPEQRIAVGVKVINDNRAGFSQQVKQEYLLSCGLSMTEYLEALNRASGGALLNDLTLGGILPIGQIVVTETETV